MPAGALAGRDGRWQIMLATGAMTLFAAIAGAAFAQFTSCATWFLVASGLCIGVADVFYRLPSGVASRLLASASYQGKPTAARQIINQVVGFVRPALAGVVVAAYSLTGSDLVSSVTFLAMAVLLFVCRSTLSNVQPRESTRPLLHDVRAEVTTEFKIPAVRPILLVFAATAGSVLPLTASLSTLTSTNTNSG